MANKKDLHAAQQSETVLVAHVRVSLTTGESFELLPFFDETDVKSKVTDLVGDWAKSGYLVRGRQIYPWHQVKAVEATSVSEISRRDSEEQVAERDALEISNLQQGFWKTKEPREKKKDGNADGQDDSDGKKRA